MTTNRRVPESVDANRLHEACQSAILNAVTFHKPYVVKLRVAKVHNRGYERTTFTVMPSSGRLHGLTVFHAFAA